MKLPGLPKLELPKPLKKRPVTTRRLLSEKIGKKMASLKGI